MNWEQFLQGFFHASGEFMGYVALLAVAMAVLRWISTHKKDAAFAKIALILIKNTLGKQLGSKADMVFDLWMDALEDVSSDATLSDDQLVDHFMDKLLGLLPDAKFTPEETQAIKTAAEACFAMLKVKQKPVKQMMALTMKK